MSIKIKLEVKIMFMVKNGFESPKLNCFVLTLGLHQAMAFKIVQAATLSLSTDILDTIT